MDWKVVLEIILVITRIGLLAFIGYLIFQYWVQKLNNKHQEKLLEKRHSHEKEMIKLRNEQEQEKEKENKLPVKNNTVIDYKHEIIKQFVKNGKTSNEHIENLSAILKLYNSENQQP